MNLQCFARILQHPGTGLIKCESGCSGVGQKITGNEVGYLACKFLKCPLGTYLEHSSDDKYFIAPYWDPDECQYWVDQNVISTEWHSSAEWKTDPMFPLKIVVKHLLREKLFTV